MRDFDAVLCDIDGCLVDEGSGPLDLARLDEVARWNRRACAHGDRPVVTLCSGRPQPFAEAMCRLVANSRLACIAENGVWLYDPGTNRYAIEPRITPADVALVRDAEAWVRDALGPLGVSIQPGKTASISLYHPDTDALVALMPRVREACDSRGWPLRVSRTRYYVNCDLDFVSKGTAIDRLCAEVGLKRARLAGIGDSESDLAIRERVAFFGCPANAVEPLRSVADYVSPYHLAEGVIDILRRLRDGQAG